MKMSIAQSALNRLLNFMDEIDAPAAPAEGAAIDAALGAPTGELPAVPGIEQAIVEKGLGLASDHS